jgi:hypothetical protein
MMAGGLDDDFEDELSNKPQKKILNQTYTI